jgi:hypothetical protein
MLVAALAAVALALTAAPAAQAATDTVEFSCSGVTFHFTGFPNANNNMVTEQLQVDGKASYKFFHFNGPAATDFFPLAVPPGHHHYDAFAKWNTNGAKGGRDIKKKKGITCPVDPGYKIEKLQRLAGTQAFTTETLPSTHVGQTLEYKIVVTNTGNVPIKMSKFSDPKCAAVSGPSEKELAVGESVVYTCGHALNAADGEAGVYCNTATISGEKDAPKTQESNTVCAELPEHSNFSQEASCKKVTFFFFGFPKTNGNTVNEFVQVDGIYLFKGTFTFNGSSGSNTIVVNIPPGHHSVDMRANWNTNGVKGGGDHKIVGGLNCVPEPEFEIEKLQKIGGETYTKEPLSGKVTDKIEYEVIIKNTGNVPLKFNGGFSDSKCDETPTGGPGEGALATGEKTTYFCSHVIKEGGPNTNTATATGTPTEGNPVTHTSNEVVVNVVVEPKFAIEDEQRIKGSAQKFTPEKINVKHGETIEYQVTIKNEGNVPFKLKKFVDHFFESGHSAASVEELSCSGGPGSGELKPTESTMFLCERTVDETILGSKVEHADNEAEAETEGLGGAVFHHSNVVRAEVS